MIGTWLAAQLAIAAACALVAEKGGARRSATAGLVALAVALPWCSPLAPRDVATLNLVSIMVLIKTTQIVSARGSWSAGSRLWHMFGIADTRRARRVPAVLDLRGLGAVLVDCALFVEARLGLRHAPPAIGRTWTIIVLLVPLPLLLGPWFHSMGIASAGAFWE